jgi:uncharacterized repeat protein (TIGR03803 family)
MKKHYFLICAFLFLGIITARAQYTVLHRFNDTTGTNNDDGGWSGSLFYEGTSLYGMTSSGGPNIGPPGCGPNGYGVIFKINTDGSDYDTLRCFNGKNGGTPALSSFISVGPYLYGMTSAGDPSCCGVVFRIKPNGSDFDTLVTFNAANGCSPTGSLYYSGTNLFGMTNIGSDIGNGLAFKIDTDGSDFDTLISFTGTTGIDPYGSFIYDGTYLYGMTETAGGLSETDYGTIFKIKPDGSDFDTLHNFNNTTGAYPYGSLLYDGNYLYGMTEAGGPANFGVIFKIKPNGSGYDTLLSFNGANGSSPYGSLISIGSYLYGMTWSGGAKLGGTIFKIDTTGTGYADLYDFNNIEDTDGINPYGSLTYDGTYLYGMTQSGGEDDYGVIFKFGDNTLGINKLSATKEAVNIYPNPSSGQFTINLNNIQTNYTVEVYNVMGEKIYQSFLYDSQNSINLSSQPAGMYFVYLKSEAGVEVQKISVAK